MKGDTAGRGREAEHRPLNDAMHEQEDHPAESNQTEGVGFRRLSVWHRAVGLAHLVYDAIQDKSFPRADFELAAQMRGAAVSVFSNIAEGYSRGALCDYIRFLEMARGSMGELSSQMDFAHQRGYVEDAAYARFSELHGEVWQMLGRLIVALRKKLEDHSWDRDYRVREEGSEWETTP